MHDGEQAAQGDGRQLVIANVHLSAFDRAIHGTQQLAFLKVRRVERSQATML